MLDQKREQYLIDKLRRNAMDRGLRVRKTKLITEEIRFALIELENIRAIFDCVDAPELIEYAIYSEKAVVSRLSYLFQLAKKGA